ncbi:MAG: sensor histidine kinase, partial [Bdellovibrionales bacterium]|nr:sensor histidine kinase [Bdellovibrionales bacterium]
TLCWVNKDKRIIGANPKFVDIFKIQKPIKEVVLEKNNKLHELHRLTETIFNESSKVSSSIEVGESTYFFAGQKYNNDQEAVIIGMDITEQHMWQNLVEKERKIAIEEAKLAELGRMLPVFTTYMDAYIQNDHSKKIIHYLSPDDTNNPCVGIDEIFQFIDELYNPYIRRKNFSLHFSTNQTEKEDFPVKSLFISLCILIQNSLEAAGTGQNHKINISHELKDRVHFIDIEDNGEGIPIEIEDVIFEPQISTKNGRLGIGLSLAQDLILDMGGTISLTSPRGPTRFTIKFKESIK